MKSKLVLLNILLIFVLFPVQNINAWECDVVLTAPQSIKVDQVKTLSASGTPAGGSYSWSRTTNLVPSGSTATLTGFLPTYSEYIKVSVSYASPKGKSCSDSAYVWVCACEVKIDGPTTAAVGETVTLVAGYAYPEGGTYAWSGPPGLVSSGDTASFTPEQAGTAEITVDYTAPDGTTCTSSIHTMEITSDCSVNISGPTSVPLGETISLSGEGSPEGGYLTWIQTPGLLSGTDAAIFVGETVGTSTVTLKYTTKEGTECPDVATHNVDTYKVGSITGPYCANSGDTVTKDKYTISTTPIGYEDKVTVSPETLSVTWAQTSEVTVTGSVTSSTTEDDATTTVLVANKDAKEGVSVSFEIPNYVNDALRLIGVGDQTDLKLTSSFASYKECCDFTSINTSRGGSTEIGLFFETAPLTLVGIQLPAKLKKYVTLDALQLALGGGGSVKIAGDYKSCLDITDWSGSGTLNLNLKVGAEAKIEAPCIVIKGSVNGSSGISETITVKSPNVVLAGSWDGLKAAGEIVVKVWGRGLIKHYAERTVLEPHVVPAFTQPLPSLKN